MCYRWHYAGQPHNGLGQHINAINELVKLVKLVKILNQEDNATTSKVAHSHMLEFILTQFFLQEAQICESNYAEVNHKLCC